MTDPYPHERPLPAQYPAAPHLPAVPAPYSAAPYSVAPYSAAPYSAPAYSVAPYGVDPLTGQPLSDKSKVIAGVLQLLPGGLLALGGIGRLYAGNVTIGVLQLVATVVGWASFWCGLLLLLPFLVFTACWLWFVIDGIVLLAGRPVDGTGRLLRS